MQLELEYGDGSHAIVASDDTWKLTADGPIRANNEYDGEEYDARMEMAGWSRAGFDDSHGSRRALVAAPAGALVAQMAEPLRVIETLRPVERHASRAPASSSSTWARTWWAGAA